MQLKDNKSGFTLIETVLYIALLAILIGGGMVGVYNILEGSGRTLQSTYREQEAYFITRKIDATLSEATEVTLPDVNLGTDAYKQLTVQTDDGTVIIDCPDCDSDEGGQIFLKRGVKDPVPLNSLLVPAFALNFEWNSASSTILTTFTLDENNLYSVSNYYYEE